MKDHNGSTLLERRWGMFILLALMLRALFLVYQISEIQRPDVVGSLSVDTGDTPTYLDPVENLIANGIYSPDYRMPGVGAPYYIFRQFMDPAGSRNALVVLQWLFSGINVYLLALLALRLSRSVVVAYVVYGLFLLSAYTSWYDASISSDSLAVSALIFHVYLLQRGIEKKAIGLISMSGFFLAWFIFLRPTSAPLLLVAAVLLFFYWGGRRTVRPVVIFLLPFLILDGAWTYRNWQVNREFNPLTNQGLLPQEFVGETRFHVMHFIQGYGGNYIWWAPGSDMRWFGVWKGGAALDNEGRNAKAPPEYAYVPGYTRDSLFQISENIRLVASGVLSSEDSIAVTTAVNARLDRYAELYQQQAPFNYHILSRVRMLKNVLWQNGSETILFRPFLELPLWEKAFKLLQIFLFIFSFTAGLAAILFAPVFWWRNRSLLSLWIPVCTAYVILIYPVVLRMCEWRYLVHIFPFALLLAICFTAMVYRMIRTRSFSIPVQEVEVGPAQAVSPAGRLSPQVR